MTSGKQSLKNRKSVQGYVEAEEREAFDEIRWREHKTESELIREAITEYIKSHAEGNSTFRLDKWNDDPNFKAIPTILSRSEIWYKYLQECSPEERLQIQIQANHINKQCININTTNT